MYNVSLTLVPPALVTNQVDLDVRGGVYNGSGETKNLKVSLYVDKEADDALLYRSNLEVPAGDCKGVYSRMSTAEQIGKHEIILVASDGEKVFRESRPIEIIPSAVRSPARINGAWVGIVHWGEQEGRLWNDEIRKMTDDQWCELIRDMKKVGMDIIVIQETVRHQAYVNKHNIEKEGYFGKAFYPSKIVPGRMEITAMDPLEAILSEADKLGMYVFPGVGCYAWFDFTPGSLEFHKQIAMELWEKYGHHKSFYGWYVSEEITGNLGETKQNKKDIVDFFREFKAFCLAIAPDKPVMLAPNCHDVPSAIEIWPKLLENIDILCPFGFHRMPRKDISGEEAAELLQKLCDEAGCRLWLDMEIFLSSEDSALYSRHIDGLVSDIQRFQNFETILCYQYPGLMNSPWASRKPGGEATVELFVDYKRFLESVKKQSNQVDESGEPIT